MPPTCCQEVPSSLTENPSSPAEQFFEPFAQPLPVIFPCDTYLPPSARFSSTHTEHPSYSGSERPGPMMLLVEPEPGSGYWWSGGLVNVRPSFDSAYPTRYGLASFASESLTCEGG